MWVAAALTPESFAWAGEHGYGLMVVPYTTGLSRLKPMLTTYIDVHEAAGHPRHNRRIQASYHLLLAEDTDSARQAAEQPLMHYLKSVVRAVGRMQKTSVDYANYDAMQEGIDKLTFAGLYERQRIIVGTPEHAVGLLRHITDHTPITDFTFVIDFGLLDRSLVERTLRLLATHVVPALRPQ